MNPLEKDFSMEESVLDFYKSLSSTHREEEEEIIVRSIENGVVPASLRYSMIKASYRGVITNKSGDYYYFNFHPGKDIKLVKAEDSERLEDAKKLYKKCKMGCDIIKVEKNEEDKEEEGKQGSEGSSKAADQNSVDKAGVVGFEATKLPISEEENVAAQDHLATQVHPGAAGSQTPEDPEDVARWHPEVEKSYNLESLRDLSHRFTEIGYSPPREASDKEREFLITVLGKTPEEVDLGVVLTPMQKVMFAQWLGKSLYKSVNSLSKWLKK